jgi:isopropylmalate/homocitrate/citramalate synthase
VTNPPTPGSSALTLVIPPETQEKFGEIIAFIQASESMNNEERQYWINILPIMTPEQVGNLRQILSNEKAQLAAIDKKYSKEIAALGQDELIRQADDERRNRRLKRKTAERQSEEAEDSQTEDLLKKIETDGVGSGA